MPRELNGHKVNGCNDVISIDVLDEPGHGGACHSYMIYIPAAKIPSDEPRDNVRGKELAHVVFQNGPIRESGTNGITHEVLLAILIDRLEGFQSGKYATVENQVALDHIRAAQATLKFRTEQRLRRSVEGTHAV